ncbi:MAG: hypothetical protein ACI38Q_05935 [Candidatus Bruticola sp.]
MLRCPACQAECSEGMRFCMECGASLSKEQPRQSVSSFGLVQAVVSSQENSAAGGPKLTRVLNASSSAANSTPPRASKHKAVSLAKDDDKPNESKKTAALSLDLNQHGQAAAPNRNKRLELMLPNNSAAAPSNKVTTPLADRMPPKSPPSAPSERSPFRNAPFSSQQGKESFGGPFSGSAPNSAAFTDRAATSAAPLTSAPVKKEVPRGPFSAPDNAPTKPAPAVKSPPPKVSALTSASAEALGAKNEQGKDKSSGKNIVLGIFIGGCGCAAVIFIIFSLFVMVAASK